MSRRLGWQQLVVITRADKRPGLSSNQLMAGLKMGNYPYKRLEALGYLEDTSPPDNPNHAKKWCLTASGERLLADNQDRMAEIEAIMKAKGVEI